LKLVRVVDDEVETIIRIEKRKLLKAIIYLIIVRFVDDVSDRG